MVQTRKVHDNIWTFCISLPNSPLKTLNCYVIRGRSGERNLLLDTGMDDKLCLEEITDGLSSLGMSFDDTDVFLTHLHPDHIGCARYFTKAGSTVFISEEDGQIVRNWNPYFSSLFHRLAHEGMGWIFHIAPYLPNGSYRPSLPKKITMVRDGEYISYGGYRFRCVLTPGHTPGHMCLYEENQKILFLGDHVLFDISPHISIWKNEDYLSRYLESLRLIENFDVRYVFPAHRSSGNLSLKERAVQLQEHHENRLREILTVIEAFPGLNAEQIAGRITWHMRETNWKKVNAMQKYFAVNETLAHIDCLNSRGLIRSERKGSTYYYYLKEKKEGTL